jgi:hypothetical protein
MIPNDIYQEMKEDTLRENKMHMDVDYAISQYQTQIDEAEETLRQVCRELDRHGWSETPKSLLGY